MKQDTTQTRSRKRKLFVTFGVLAVMAGLTVFVTSASFSSTTSNPGNRIEAGSVAVGDSDGTTGVLYNALDQAPGPAAGPVSKCIRVDYTGSLASSLKLYSSAIAGGSNFRLKVERGSGITSPAADMNCTGFGASSTAFDNTLDNFPTTYAAGIDGKAGGSAWATGNSVDYKFTVYVVDDSTPNAHTSKVDSAAHSFTWEARNN
jgi:hypothetical protein